MHRESITYLEEKYSFWGLFEGSVISCRIHRIKPEREIYEYLLEKHGLVAAETVFIDDTSVNLLAAKKFGIRTIKFEDSEQCERQLAEMGFV